MKEIFKDIKDYEGRYQISNLGNVKSLPFKYLMKGIYPSVSKEKMLTKFTSPTGYFLVKLYNGKFKKTVQVHQLVAEAFLNHKPCGYKLVVNHIDFDRKNNNINNLEIVTPRINSNKKHIKSSSDFTGVGWDSDRNKWRAQIYLNGKNKFLGRFNTETEANNAYQKALKEIL